MNIKRLAIYRANLDPVSGSEQGTSRPVVVISEVEINSLINTEMLECNVNEYP